MMARVRALSPGAACIVDSGLRKGDKAFDYQSHVCALEAVKTLQLKRVLKLQRCGGALACPLGSPPVTTFLRFKDLRD